MTLAFCERFYTAADGLELYFRDYGDAAAPAVLCLGGLTRNSRDFADLASRLAPRWRVLCPDYRGRGRSARDPRWRNYHAKVYLDDLRHLLASTGVDRAVVVGTSLGGILAMAMGVMLPTVPRAVVLNDIGPTVEGGGMDRIRGYIGRDRPEPDFDAAVAALQAMFPGMSFQHGDGWRKFSEATYRRGGDGRWHFDWDPNILDAMNAAGPVPDLWPMFRSLRRLPVLAIRGGLSDVLSETTLQRMAAEKPDLRRVTVAGCGHCPALDEPEVLEALDDFLARL